VTLALSDEQLQAILEEQDPTEYRRATRQKPSHK